MKVVGYMVSENGHPMVFIRPHDPELAMSLALDLMGKPHDQVEEKWNEIIRRQTYSYLGFVAQVEKYNYLGKKTVELWIADEHGKLVARPNRRDSIVSSPEIAVPEFMRELTIEGAN